VIGTGIVVSVAATAGACSPCAIVPRGGVRIAVSPNGKTFG
jgi:hypothetical protein